MLADIAEDKGSESVEAIRASGAGADFLQLDVTDLASIEAFGAAIAACGRQVDFVVNVAGWGKMEPFVKNSPDNFITGQVLSVSGSLTMVG